MNILYGGTKEEMQKLIADANEYRASIGETSDLTIESFADIVTAIQTVQEQQNIAGTTGREAMTTIEGSATMVKAAWENLTTAIGSGEGIKEAFSGLKDAIFGIGLTEDGKETGLLNQIVPRIQTIMSGIGDMILESAPIISEKLPPLIEEVLPPMIDGGIKMAGAIGKGLIDAIPALGSTLSGALGTLGSYFLTGLDSAVQAVQTFDFAGTAKQFSDKMVSFFTGDGVNHFIESGFKLIGGLITGIGQALPSLIPAAVQCIYSLGNTFIQNVPTLIDAGINLIKGLAQGIVNAIPLAIQGVTQCWTSIFNLYSTYGGKIVTKAGEIFKKVIDTVVEWLGQLPTKVAHYAGETVAKFKNKIDELPDKAKQAFDNAVKKAEDFVKKFKEKAADGGKGFRDDLMNAITGLIDDIGQFFDNLRAKVEEKWNSLVSFVTGKKSEMDAAYNEGYNNTRNVPEGHSGKSGVLNAAPLFDAIDYTTGLNNEFSTNTVIDYDLLGKAIVKAFTDADVAVECDDREFGRLVRKAVME